MHFPIIEISDHPLAKDDWMGEFDLCEDVDIHFFSDYTCDAYSEKERKEYIASDYFRELFDGLATVNAKEGSITFLDEDTIRVTLKSYYRDTLEKLKKKLETERFDGFDLRYEGFRYKENHALFHDGCTHSSMQWIEDSVWRAGKTYYIGGIVNAHA